MLSCNQSKGNTLENKIEKRKEKMRKELNECIDVKGFAYLILDYEYKAIPEWGLPAGVSCRVLIEDVYQNTIHAGSRSEAVEMFRSGAWKN